MLYIIIGIVGVVRMVARTIIIRTSWKIIILLTSITIIIGIVGAAVISSGPIRVISDWCGGGAGCSTSSESNVWSGSSIATVPGSSGCCSSSDGEKIKGWSSNIL